MGKTRPKSTTASLQENLNQQLKTLLVGIEGDLKNKGEEIIAALNRVISSDTEVNRAILDNQLRELMTASDSKRLHIKELKSMVKFMDQVATFLNTSLQDVHAYNEYIKEEKKKLKERIDEKIKLRLGR